MSLRPERPRAAVGPQSAPSLRATTVTVKWTERMLRVAGFAVGAQGLRQFQAAWGLPTTGKLDEQTLGRLKQVELRMRAHQRSGDAFEGVGPRGAWDPATPLAVARGTLPARQRPRLDQETAVASAQLNAGGMRGIGPGSRGRWVANVQAHLQVTGFDPKGTRGTFDVPTQRAVVAFQRQSALPLTGRVDFATWAKLKEAFLYAKSADRFSPELNRRWGTSNTERGLRELGYRVRTDGFFDERPKPVP